MEPNTPPTMLDALAAEAKDIMDLQAQSSRISIEATRKAGLLWKQITAMADTDRQRVVDPDYVPLKRDGVLTAYATSDKTPGDIGDDFDLHWRQVDRMLRRARKEGDPRAAQGDLLRQPADVAPEVVAPLLPRARPSEEIHKQPPYKASGPKRDAPTKALSFAEIAVPAEMTKVAPPLDKSPPGLPLCELDLDDRRVTFEMQSVQLLRIGFRIVHFLNDQEPKSLNRLLKHLNLPGKRTLDREMKVVRQALEGIGLTVKELLDAEYQLQPFPSA